MSKADKCSCSYFLFEASRVIPLRGAESVHPSRVIPLRGAESVHPSRVIPLRGAESVHPPCY